MNSETVNITKVDHYYRIDFHVNRDNRVIANLSRVMLKDGAVSTLFTGAPRNTKSESLAEIGTFLQNECAWINYSSVIVECEVCHRKHNKNACPNCGHEVTIQALPTI